MRRVLVFICYAAMILLFVSACSNNTEKDSSNTEKSASDFTDSAVAFGEKFIKQLYSVNDSDVDVDTVEAMTAAQNKFSTYLTEKEFNALANKRFFLMPQEAANKQKSTISVQNITLKKSEGDQEKSKALDFDHTFTLIFTDQAGKEVTEVEINGQMTVIDTEDGLKIDRYYDSQIPMDLLNP